MHATKTTTVDGVRNERGVYQRRQSKVLFLRGCLNLLSRSSCILRTKQNSVLDLALDH